MLPVMLLAFSAAFSRAYAQAQTEAPPSDGLIGESSPADSGPANEGILGSDVPSSEDYLSANDENTPSIGVWNILIALMLVLVIFWVIFRFVVRPLMRGAVLGRGVEDFRIVASLPIAPTKSVQIIKLVDRLLVVGIAEGGMRLLSEITDAAEVSDMLKILDAQNPAKHHPFRKAFDTILTRKDESGFEDKQKRFNTTLDDLKQKIKAMKDSPEDKE